MKVVIVSIEGVTPLLQHRFASESQDTGKPRPGVPDWKSEADKSLYKDPDGVIYQPSTHLERCFVEAAKQFKIAGKRGATYSKLVAATVEVWPDAIPHEVQDWVPDERPVVVNRARVMRYRPRFDKWRLEFEIHLADDQLSVEIMRAIVDYGGSYVGIGDFRPGKGGKFGKFSVVSWEVR